MALILQLPESQDALALGYVVVFAEIGPVRVVGRIYSEVIRDVLALGGKADQEQQVELVRANLTRISKAIETKYLIGNYVISESFGAADKDSRLVEIHAGDCC